MKIDLRKNRVTKDADYHEKGTLKVVYHNMDGQDRPASITPSCSIAKAQAAEIS